MDQLIFTDIGDPGTSSQPPKFEAKDTLWGFPISIMRGAIVSGIPSGRTRGQAAREEMFPFVNEATHLT